MAEVQSGWKTIRYSTNGEQYGGSQVNVSLEASRASDTSPTINVKVWAQVRPISSTWWDSYRPYISVSGSVSASGVQLGASSDSSWYTVASGTVTNQGATTISISFTATQQALGGSITAGGSASGTLSIDIPSGYFVDTFYVLGSSVGTRNHAQGGTVTTMPAQSRAGYTFGGWKAAWNNVVYGANTAVAAPNANSRFDAVMTPIEYTVSFNANGGVGEPPASIKVRYTQSATIPSSSLTKIGHDFKGWSDSNSSTTAIWTTGGSYTQNVANNRTLYAVWERYLFAPDPATNVHLSNVLDEDMLDNQHVAVTWNAAEQTRAKGRKGWRIYDAVSNQLLLEMEDDGSAGPKSADITIDIEARTLTVAVVAWNELEESAKAQSNIIYGRLSIPVDMRTLRKGEFAEAEVIDDDNSSYPYELRIGYSYDQVEWVDIAASYVELVGEAYRNETIYLRGYRVPAASLELDDELYRSPYLYREILPGPKTPPVKPAAVQDITPHPDGPHCVVTWNPVMKDGVEDADYYLVKTVTPQGETHEIANVTAIGTDNPDYLYKVDFLWMGAASVKVIIIAVKNGWESVPVEMEYEYNPQYLKPPVIMAIEHIEGFYYDVLFEPATGGIRYDEGSEEAGYLYTLYMDNVQATYQVPDDLTIIPSDDETQHRIRMKVYSPRQVFIRLAATDERKRSVLSNTMGVSHQSPGVGMLVHGCKSLTIDSCVIENLSTAAISAYEGTNVEISNTLLRVSEGAQHYDIEDSTVVELNCEYE